MPSRFIHLLLPVISAFWIAIVQHDPFFWDTIQLGSKHAHFFYNNHLNWQVLPPAIDSGHPPVFGYYIALFWTLFGKSLPVSHWAMWPFLYGVLYLSFLIGRRWSGSYPAAAFALLLIADPVFATQASLISPDLVLLFFFLCALEGIWSERQWMVALGILGLSLISMRGMMVCSALSLWVVIREWPLISTRPGMLWNKAYAFLPGVLAGGGFLLWHYKMTGWVGYHDDSPWALGFQRSDALGILRNAAILIWRWIDLGRLAEWVVFGYLAWLLLKGRISGPSRDLLLLLLITTALLSPSALLHNNLSAHRYFLPAFAVLHLLIANWIGAIAKPTATRTLLLVSICLVFMSGHAWIYPRGISMDWDCTLAHRSYHDLRSDMQAYLNSQGIDIEEVGSAFPNINTGEDLMLNGDTRSFKPFDLDSQTYILSSNVFNDIDTEHYRRLEADWSIEKRLERGGIWMILYKKIPPG